MPFEPNPNLFANNPLDRQAHRRMDDAWLDARWRDASSRTVPLWRLKPLIALPQEGHTRPAPGWLPPAQAQDLAPEGALRVFLGVQGEVAYFAVDVSAIEDPKETGILASSGKFIDLRSIAQDLHPGDAAILGEAKALIDWHQRHLFCAVCSHESGSAEGGHKRVCPACEQEHFPRTDPVVITLVVHSAQCLLGRGTAFPETMYSALAGFVEPGESIEEAVRREVWEEVGVEVSGVRYLFSQPWPFPSSLMIGCLAEANSDALTLDPTEIADAKWLTRSEVSDLLQGKADRTIMVPPPMAIAHQLLKYWVRTGQG